MKMRGPGPELNVHNYLLPATGRKTTRDNWTKDNGFKFSDVKTQVVHFSKIQGLHNLPELKLGGEKLY